MGLREDRHGISARRYVNERMVGRSCSLALGPGISLMPIVIANFGLLLKPRKERRPVFHSNSVTGDTHIRLEMGSTVYL
jgi:hypothetical protein